MTSDFTQTHILKERASRPRSLITPKVARCLLLVGVLLLVLIAFAAPISAAEESSFHRLNDSKPVILEFLSFASDDNSLSISADASQTNPGPKPELPQYISDDTPGDYFVPLSLANTNNRSHGYHEIPGFSVANTYTEEELNGGLFSPQGATTLPASYDLRDLGLVTSVKNQNPYETCWAFAVINSIESNAVKKGYETLSTADFSELQLVYFMYNRNGVTTGTPLPSLSGLKGDDVIISDGDYLEGGGTSKYAALHLATGIGVVRESDVPYTWAGSSLSPGYAVDKNAYVVSNAYFATPLVKNDVKELLMDYGCGTVSYFDDSNYHNTSLYKGKSSSNYYQTHNSDSNHAVSLVGWDDNYPKENFKITPKNNGAWLIKNSWGDNWGDEGYFWLSYEDTSLTDVVFFEVRKADSFDNIYQYDGSVGIIFPHWNNAESGFITTPKAVNYFTAKDNEKIIDVSFVTFNRDVSYTVEILKNNGKDVVFSQSGTVEQCGCHTIHLSQPVNVNKGEKFGVAVTFTASAGTVTMSGVNGLAIPIDMNHDSGWIKMVSSSRPGQGYLYFDDGLEWDAHNYDGNLRIKAFTVITGTHSDYHPGISGDWKGVDSLSKITNDGNYYLTTDVTLNGAWSVPSGKKINLCLNGHVIKQNATNACVIFVRGSDTRLNLYDCDTTTIYYFSEGDDGLWSLCDESSFDWGVEGGVITGGNDEYCGGVRVDEGGVFNMYGGNIVGNSAVNNGGGVNVDENSEFVMHNGLIAGNIASYGAGVISFGTYTMSGGDIVYNRAGTSGGGVYSACESAMSGGSILYNAALYGGGIYTDKRGTFEMSGGSVTENFANFGGGALTFGKFIMSNGEISQNTAYRSGGGFYVYDEGEFTMSGKASVNANNEIYLGLNNVIGIAGTEFTGSAGNITGPQTETDGNTVVVIVEDSPITASDIMNKFALQDKTKKLVASSDGKELKVAQSTPSPKISAATLSLSSDIAVRFYVNDSSLAGYHNAYMTAAFNDTEYTLQPTADPQNPRRMFTFRNISPAEMNETICVKLYATKDGEASPVFCDELDYSIKDYCMNQINNAGVKNDLTTLCADLLNYGSASQLYCGETDMSKLANSTLSDEQKDWASQFVIPEIRNDKSISETGNDSVGVWRAASLNLYSDISLFFKFTTSENPENLTAIVTYGKDGENKAEINKFIDSTYGAGLPCKYIDFDKLNALELNYPITVVLKNKDGATSKTLTYSVDAYAFSKTGSGKKPDNLTDLVDSMMKYIRSVDNLFNEDDD